ncbi:hypothetical protein OKW34_000092 [Paraburkholderia youngii]|uniref:hypothetical protein n=1 Tax=Paraburkholderia youngii TaxID=2782701 RepID=UPI003D1A8B63
MLRWQAEDTPFVTTGHCLPDKPDGVTLFSAVRPILSDAFDPAPPARMNVIRCFGLGTDALFSMARFKIMKGLRRIIGAIQGAWRQRRRCPERSHRHL